MRIGLVSVLKAVTAVGLLCTGLLFAWTPSTHTTLVPPSLPSVVATGGAPAAPAPAPALSDSIVGANIFSLTREAPTARTFVAAPMDPQVDSLTGGVYLANGGIEDSTGALALEPVPYLYGVVDGPQGAAALLRLDPMRSGSRLYRLGEGTGGYTVRSIGTDRVELDGPSGAVVVTLTAKAGTP